MLLSTFLNFKFFGYNLSGWSWVIIFILSLLRVVQHIERIAFPLWIWAPWTGLILLYGFSGYEYAWQSTAQILCPVVAGVAASTYRIGPADIERLGTLIRRVYWLYCVGFVLVVVPFVLQDIKNSRFAVGAITALFFQSFFLANYLLNGRKTADLLCYLSAVAIPVISANRGPLLASVALPVLAFMPISVRRRLVIAAGVMVIGIVAFYTPKVQHKMFFSGRGDLRDLRLDNPNLNTNGRRVLWEAMENGSSEKPWFGHGGNADRTWLLTLGFEHYLPHNDWLRIRFNYGWIGALLYSLTLLAQVLYLRKAAVVGECRLKALSASAISCFVPYAIVMCTDNTLIYCQYFTVPVFVCLGAASAARRRSRVRLVLPHACRGIAPIVRVEAQ